MRIAHNVTKARQMKTALSYQRRCLGLRLDRCLLLYKRTLDDVVPRLMHIAFFEVPAVK
jgi:hypothetical protein